MANGHALKVMPSVAPAAAPAAPAVEQRIGTEIARAAILVCLAAEEHRAGQSTLPITRQAGEVFARLYEIQQSTPDIDFNVVAARAGKRALRTILMQDPTAAATLCKHGDLDRTLDEILGWPLSVLARVVEFERRLAN